MRTINRELKDYIEQQILPIYENNVRHSRVSLLLNEYLKTGQTDTAKFFVMMSNRLGHTVEVI